MSKYMLILGGMDLDKRSGNKELAPIMMEKYMLWVGSLQRAGALVSTHKLYDQTGKRLTLRGGEVVEGPFIETKDAVGGVFIIEARSLDEATDFGRSCPVLKLQNGYVEVRPIEEVRGGPR